MLGKFNLYDFIAVVIPGIFFLWALGLVVDLPAIKEAFPLNGNLAETSVLIVVGYVVGLILQGISQHIFEGLLKWIWGGFPSDRMLLPEDKTLPSEYKENLISLIRERFGLEVKTSVVAKKELPTRLKENQAAFRLCYRSIDKLSEVPTIFNAQYGLFRSLLTTSILLLFIKSYFIIKNCYSLQKFESSEIAILSLLLVVIAVFYVRVKKRGFDFARSVYDLFYSNFSQNINNSKNKEG